MSVLTIEVSKKKYPTHTQFALTLFHRMLEVIQHAVVVHPTQHLLFHQGKLLSRRQLPLAGEASEAGEVVHIALGSPYPVSGVDASPTARTPGPVSSV